MTQATRPQPPRHARIRQAKRASYDRAAVHAVLDHALIGHVGFIADDRPMVIPMIYARRDDRLYLHGASKTRIAKLAEGAAMSLEVTQLTGLVVARSGFHHSVNFRSAIIHGRASPVSGAEKEDALWRITDHLLPGRSAEIRAMTAQEIKATGVLALDIEEAAMKYRNGPPVDDEADLDGSWAGILPVTTALGTAIADAHSAANAVEPASLMAARQKFAGMA